MKNEDDYTVVDLDPNRMTTGEVWDVAQAVISLTGQRVLVRRLANDLHGTPRVHVFVDAETPRSEFIADMVAALEAVWTDDSLQVRGCSCGMADYGAPGHEGHKSERQARHPTFLVRCAQTEHSSNPHYYSGQCVAPIKILGKGAA